MRIYVSGHREITDERLLAAARNDDEDMILEILDDDSRPFDINFQDGSVRYSQPDLRSLLPFPL